MGNTARRILVIPHSADWGVKRRLVEVARHLSVTNPVFILNWEEPANNSLIERVTVTLKDFFKTFKHYRKDGLDFLQCPILHRPLSAVHFYNQYFLTELVAKYSINTVINGTHYFFPVGKFGGLRHIFDLNDLPALETKSGIGRFAYEFARKQVACADKVVACSRGLVKYAKEEFGCQAQFIPNGADLKKIREVDLSRVEQLKTRLNLSGKFVIGYIGKVGEWIDLDFTINFFKEVKTRCSNAALLIVGKTDSYNNYPGDKDIVFTGPVPAEDVSVYLSLIDIGILPGKKSLFQDMAFHIKLIEYTAAGKMVLSSPLEEVKKLGFPNIFIADLTVDKWLCAFQDIRRSVWQVQWDWLVKDYDWKDISGKFLKLV